MALVTDRKTATTDTLQINLLENLFKDALEPDLDRHKHFWQVFDRTTGEMVNDWEYIGDDIVKINKTIPYH